MPVKIHIGDTDCVATIDYEVDKWLQSSHLYGPGWEKNTSVRNSGAVEIRTINNARPMLLRFLIARIMGDWHQTDKPHSRIKDGNEMNLLYSNIEMIDYAELRRGWRIKKSINGLDGLDFNGGWFTVTLKHHDAVISHNYRSKLEAISAYRMYRSEFDCRPVTG